MKSGAPKTPKLWIGGAFVRSESGRTYKVGNENVPMASRKDVRDAVQAARKAQPGWANATAYNRGQVLYRLAEMMTDWPDNAVNRVIHYAGWTDKFSAISSTVNPVAGKIHNYTSPEPTGVVVAIAGPTLVDVVESFLAPIATGNSVVVLLNENQPLPALELAEQLATSDLPGGVVNFLSGSEAELLPHLAGHEDVDALDLSGSALAADGYAIGSNSVKRIRTFSKKSDSFERLEAFVEFRTVWHSTAW